MLKIITSRLAWLALCGVGPIVAQGETATIRTTLGARYEVPAGWEWTEFDGINATIQHLATKSGVQGKEESPNRLSVGWRAKPDEDFDSSWEQLARNAQQTLPNGVKVRWKAGTRWGMHFVFHGEARLGSQVLNINILDSLTPRIDVRIIEAAFLSIAGSLREVPSSPVIYHPTLGMAVDTLSKKSWYCSFNKADIAFRCWTNGRSGDTWLYTFPADGEFADAGQALAKLTSTREKEQPGLKIGEVKRATVAGGEVLWTEQPGSVQPFLGVVRRDGRYFFVEAYVKASTFTQDALRKDYLSMAKSVRTWDGK